MSLLTTVRPCVFFLSATVVRSRTADCYPGTANGRRIVRRLVGGAQLQRRRWAHATILQLQRLRRRQRTTAAVVHAHEPVANDDVFATTRSAAQRRSKSDQHPTVADSVRCSAEHQQRTPPHVTPAHEQNAGMCILLADNRPSLVSSVIRTTDYVELTRTILVCQAQSQDFFFQRRGRLVNKICHQLRITFYIY